MDCGNIIDNYNCRITNSSQKKIVQIFWDIMLHVLLSMYR